MEPTNDVSDGCTCVMKTGEPMEGSTLVKVRSAIE